MEHKLALVAILTIGFGCASILAYIAQRLKLPSILGYLLAGFVIGPYSPGFVADLALSEQLAEIGVILMLFGVGLHFKLEDLVGVKNIAIPGATAQTLVAAIFGAAIVYASGWTLQSGIIIGLAIGVASTVVLVRVLTDFQLLNTIQGHIAVGWLVVEDIFTVVILVLLPSLASFAQGQDFSTMSILGNFILVIAKFGLLALLMFTGGQKIVSYLLTNVARLRSQELFTLSVLALVFVIAAGSAYVFGTSIALGAFIAGMVIGKTTVRHQAAANALPLKDIFAIIFFLSVGMLFNPGAISDNLWLFLGITFVILVIKPVTAFVLTLVLNYPLKVALTVAIALAQIGEFSFILAEEAMKYNILPDEGYDILVACAMVSISLNPLLFQAIEKLEPSIEKLSFFKKGDFPETKMKQKRSQEVILVGYGPIGRSVSEILKQLDMSTVIIEQNIDTVSQLEEHAPIIFGDASDTTIMDSAQVEKARYLIVTIPDTTKTINIIHAARSLNPNIEILTRVRYISEQPLMDAEQVYYVCSEKASMNAFLDLVRNTLKA